MDGAAMDYFLIELVRTLRHSSSVATERSKKIEDEMIEFGLIPAPPLAPPALKATKGLQRESIGSVASAGSALKTLAEKNDDDDEDGVQARLEAIGLHVGANITERWDLNIDPMHAT